MSVSFGVLEVSVSGYFSWVRRQRPEGRKPAKRLSDEALLAHIRAIHAEVKGEYGAPRMHKVLLARGIRVGKERVRAGMRLPATLLDRTQVPWDALAWTGFA